MEPRRSFFISFWLFHYPTGFPAAAWNLPILDYFIDYFDIQTALLQLHGTPPIFDYFIDYFIIQPALLQLLGTRQSLTISLIISLSTWNPPILVFFIGYFIVQPNSLQPLVCQRGNP